MTQHFNKSRSRVRQKLVFICLLLAFVVSCAKQERRFSDSSQPSNANTRIGNSSITPRVNINTATERELKTLPGIGEELAARIVAYRKRSGPFRKPEHLLLVEGISEGRLHDILPLIKVE